MDRELINSKISGVLIGLIVGDLLGEQVEGQKTPGIIKQFRANAKYTDDTEMTFITLNHLIIFQDIKPVTLAIEYSANMTPTRKYGGNAFKTLRKIKNYPELWDTAYQEFLPEASYGNGCIMRIAPIALFDLKADRDTLTRHLKDSLISTHDHLESLQCSLEYCLLLRDIFHESPSTIQANHLIQAILDRNLNPRLTTKVQLIWDQIIASDQINQYDKLLKFVTTEIVEFSVRCSDTLALVIAALAYNLKYKQWSPSSLLSIMISFGGDTDTNASILGAFLGCLYGVEDFILVEWYNKIENKKELTDEIHKFTQLIAPKLLNAAPDSKTNE